MQNKHILYITYDGLTDFLGQSQVLPYIIGLEKEGYRFSILSFEKPDKLKENKSLIENLIANKNIDWHPKKYHKRFSILATLWDLFIGFFFLIQYKSKNPFQAVHCRSYIPAILGLLSKKIFHTKFIFDMRGFWADERVDGNLWDLNKPIFKLVYRFFKWIEKKSILNADYVVTLTQNSYREMQQWEYVTGKIKFKIIPCCVDLEVFNPQRIFDLDLKKIKQDLELDDKIVISYLGSVGTWYMIDEMFEFFKTFKIKKTNAVFLFITPEEKTIIHSIAFKHNIPLGDIRIVKALRKDVAKYIAVSNFSLFFIKPAYSKKSSSPTKLAEIMAMGVPVICNNCVGDVETQVVEAKAGVIVEAFNEITYNTTIRKLDHELNANFEKNVSIKYVEENFSLDRGVKLYMEIYQEIIV